MHPKPTPCSILMVVLMLNIYLSSCEVILGTKLRSLQIVSSLDSLAQSGYSSIQIFHLMNWIRNDQIIKSINSDQKSTFTVSHNQFSYLSLNQITQKYLKSQTHQLPKINVKTPQKSSLSYKKNDLFTQQAAKLNKPPFYNIDWRKNLSGPVNNQGTCGACWAFAAVADLQTTYAIKYKIQIDFSEQQLIDCSSSYGNQGCGGGMMNNAYQYVIKFGITLESYYPYRQTAKQCKYNPTFMPHFSISKSNIIYGNCNALVSVLKERPVSVVISANIAFIFYQSGILNSCGSVINHALQLVGIVKNQFQSYYIGKNSWGVNWGMQGYVFIDSKQQDGNLCNICAYPQYPS